MITCGYCGYRSTLVECFVEKAITDRPPSKVCPGCVIKLDAKENFKIVSSYLVMLVLGIVTVYWAPDFKYGMLILNFVAILVLLWLSLFLHEFAHYLAGIFLGGTVPLVQIGTGPLWKRVWVAGTSWEIRAYWFSGCVYSGFENEKFSLTKCFLIYAAGPLLNIVLVILSIVLMNKSDTYLIFDVVNIPLALIVANLLLLLPSRSTFGKKDPSSRVSDARRMYEIITGEYPHKKDDYDQSVLMIRLHNFAHRKMNEKGLEISREALARFPKLYLFRFYEAAFLVECENFELAISKATKALDDLAEEVPTDDALEKIHTVLLKICIADAINEDTRNTDYSFALELSKFAFDAMPWDFTVLVIYGKALAAVGETKEALSVLKRALTFEMSKSRAIEISAVIGLIYHSLGNSNEANDWLTTSKTYKGTHLKQNELERLLTKN